MKKTQKVILLTELQNVKQYVARLLIVVKQLGPETPSIQLHAKHLLINFFEGLSIKFNQSFLAHQFKANEELQQNSIQTISDHIEDYLIALEALIKIPTNNNRMDDKIIELLNLCYHHCYCLHQLSIEAAPSLDIAYPRSLLTNCELVNSTYKYQIEIDDLSQFQENVLGPLEAMRKKHFAKFMQEGLTANQNNLHQEALTLFQKAANFQETEEILTLIAQTLTIMDQLNEAQLVCLKAIKLNPSYGPAYNQIGTILIKEGQLEESLIWFEKAKKATNFIHREYPYINAGRVYMMKHDFESALNEFSNALTFVPDNTELHETTQRVKALTYRNHEVRI